MNVSPRKRLARRIFKGFAVLAMLVVLGVGALLGSVWLERRTEITLPTPVGPFAVGRAIYLDINARMQYQATVLAGDEGVIAFMDAAEVEANVAWQNYERSWNLWKAKALAKLAAEKKA